jgi:hypothetical protein
VAFLDGHGIVEGVDGEWNGLICPSYRALEAGGLG